MPSGELTITGYSIRYTIHNRNYFRYKSATVTSVVAMITDLVPGTAYRVYVEGLNDIGIGQYCCEGTEVVVRTYSGKFS